MRTTILLASMLSIAALQNPADACGPYGGIRAPSTFALSSHSIVLERGKWTSRSFVMIGGEPEGKPAWRELAPGTYDYTRIADAPELDTPVELTLVGPSGNQVISTRSRVYIAPAWGDVKATTALEIPRVKRADFVVALSGRHADSKWIALEGERPGTASDVAWIKQLGVEVETSSYGSYVHVSKVKGTELETVTAMTKKGGMQSFVRSSGTAVNHFTGTIAGFIRHNGALFVVRKSEGAVRPLLVRGY